MLVSSRENRARRGRPRQLALRAAWRMDGGVGWMIWGKRSNVHQTLVGTF